MTRHYLLDHIQQYPTTQMVMGQVTADEVILANASKLFDEYVCDCRYNPIDVIRMMILVCNLRGVSLENGCRLDHPFNAGRVQQ